MTAEVQQETYFSLSIQAGQIFNPTTPVNEKDLFSGRTLQIRRVADAIFQRGQHAIIFGERGVGKTSLANVLQDFLPTASNLLVTRINCDSADDFTSVWKKVFKNMGLAKTRSGVGFNSIQQPELFNPAVFFKDDENITHQVFEALSIMPKTIIPVVIMDEFDRMDEDVRKLFADFIKSLSDQALSATVILIGVGDSVNQLITEHQSVSRALMQIQMPRMTQEEIEAIITNSLTRIGNMTIDDNTLHQIKTLSKGLPHYAHLIGLHATRDALDKHSLNITDENLKNAIKKAIEDCQHSIRTNYHKAIRSTKKVNLFEDVLLACAMAEVNELGEFAAQDLRAPMLKITGKSYGIPSYAQHLAEFCDAKRGNILIKTGERKRFRYKFTDPLMQPFIIMQGILRGKNP
jgi:Cdc6-like AAA superfamily ATPase